ncbi:hypothetical protein ARMGADRAFT_1034963 [Armillaria gallica]|uniref:Uncharacterized protein n=1 Tax=Armillaria gallica TaxID=47427 RepID=A0A2H3CWL0_ARMGA|nr:hypothetical protein ARMGADRAFT_1034963 [Armillaria gallica]
MCQYNEEVERDEWKQDTVEGPLRRDTAMTGKGGGTSVAVEGHCRREGHLRMEGHLWMEGYTLQPDKIGCPRICRVDILSLTLAQHFTQMSGSPDVDTCGGEKLDGRSLEHWKIQLCTWLDMTIHRSSPMPILLEPPQMKRVLRQQYRVLAGAKHHDCKGKNKTKGGGYDTQIYTHQVPFNGMRVSLGHSTLYHLQMIEPFLEREEEDERIDHGNGKRKLKKDQRGRMFPCGAPGFARDFIGIHSSARMYIHLNWFTLVYIGVHPVKSSNSSYIIDVMIERVVEIGGAEFTILTRKKEVAKHLIMPTNDRDVWERVRHVLRLVRTSSANGNLLWKWLYKMVHNVDIWMPSYSPTGGGVIDTSVGREIGIPHIIYHIPHGRRFGDIMNGPLNKIGYRVKGDLLIMAFDLENQSEVCNLTDDDIDGALYFVNELDATADVFLELNNAEWMVAKAIIMEDSVVSHSLNTIVQSYYRGSRDAIVRLVYEQNISLREEDAATSVYVDQKENMVLKGLLLGRLHFGMCLMGEVVFPDLHNNHWLCLGLPSRGASGEILFDAQIKTLQGLFLKDHCKDLPSRSWIYECDVHKESLVYVDPEVVRKKVDAPNNWFVDVEGTGPSRTPTTEAILDEAADFPVQIRGTLKKHTSVVWRCKIFVVHVEEMEIIPY